MTRALHDLLNDSARVPRTELDAADLWRRGRARRRRKQLGTAVAAVAVLGVVGGVALGDPAVRLAPGPLGDQPSHQTVAPVSYDRSVELASDVAPLEGTVVLTEPFAEELPPKDGAGENPCCLVVHPSGPALVDDLQKVLRVYPGVHSVGYARAGLDVFSAAALDSGAVALFGRRPGGPTLVILPLAELPDLTQASGPFFEPPIERVDIPDDADAVVAGRGGFWVHAGDEWIRVTDADGVSVNAAEVAERPVLRDGSAVDAEERADGSAVLYQQAEEFTLRLELAVPDRRVSIQRIEAVDGPAPHTLLIVLRVDGEQGPEHRLLGISGNSHVDYGTLAPGDTWTERLAITASGQLYHLHSDDAGVTVTRYTADLARLGRAKDADPAAEEDH